MPYWEIRNQLRAKSCSLKRGKNENEKDKDENECMIITTKPKNKCVAPPLHGTKLPLVRN